MWREWYVVICFCLSVSNEAASVHHKKQSNYTVVIPTVSSGNPSSSVNDWLGTYWYVSLVVVLVLVVTGIFACACVVKKARGNHTHYHMDATSTRSAPPFVHPFSRPPLSSIVDGSLSPGMVSMESPVPSPQPSYSSQRSSGRSSGHKKKRTLSPGQNSSGSEETIRSDKGMLRAGPWQQHHTPNSMLKLSIGGVEQFSTSLPEATSMLSVRSNHSGRSCLSTRSGHTHSDASSQKTMVEVDVKLHLSQDQEQDARMMTAAALAESARQLARSAARLGDEEEPYQVFSHSLPRIYYHSSRVGLSQQQPPQWDLSAGSTTTPLTCTTISLDRAVNPISLDHPSYSSNAPRGKHGHLSPASPLTTQRSVASDNKRSVYPNPSHSPTKLLSSGMGSLDRPHPSSYGMGFLDRPHPSNHGMGSLDRPHPHSPGKASSSGMGSMDRPHPHSPTRALRPGVGSLDKTYRSSSSLQRTRVPSVNSDRLPCGGGDAHSQDPLRQFYEQDRHSNQDTPPGYKQDGHSSRGSQDTPPGYRHTSVGCRDYSTIDMDGIDTDMESTTRQHCRNSSVNHNCYENQMDVRLCTLPHHYITSASQDSRAPVTFGQLSCGVARTTHEPIQLHLQDRPMETRVTKRQSESCAEDSGFQTTSFSEEHNQLPPSPCCSSSAPSVEEEPQQQVAHTETVVYEKQQSLLTAQHQHTPPAISHQILPRSNSGLSADEQLSTASGYAATGSASSIDTTSNGPTSQSNQYELEPRTLRQSSHSGVSQCDLASPAGAHQWDPSSPDLTPQEQSHDSVSQAKRKHHSSSTNWTKPVIKYSNHGDQESMSVEI